MICNSIDLEDVAQLLQEGGCSGDFIQKFITTMKTKPQKEVFRMLRSQRNWQLGRLHEEGKKLDQLDFLRDMLKNRLCADHENEREMNR